MLAVLRLGRNFRLEIPIKTRTVAKASANAIASLFVWQTLNNNNLASGLAQTAYKEYDDQHQWRDAFGGAERKILGNGPAVRSASLLERGRFELPVLLWFLAVTKGSKFEREPLR